MRSTTFSAVRNAIKSKPAGTLFVTKDFTPYGSPSAIATALSRLARDGGPLSRVRRGIYFRAGSSRFGVGSVSGVATILKYAEDKAAGPSGASAAAMLGLSTQMPAFPEIAIVGRPPASFPGVRFYERSNTKRVAMGLKPKEIAVLELARDKFASAEMDLPAVRSCFEALSRAGEIDKQKITIAAEGEPRDVRRCLEGVFA